jgi:hypothetical protein
MRNAGSILIEETTLEKNGKVILMKTVLKGIEDRGWLLS